MNANLLPNIKIASPCHADWGQMTGNERTRFCASCQKNVFNLSAMTARQAADLIREKEGRLCVRYYLRRDGTILTRDCPVGLAAVRKQFLKIAAVFVGAFALLGFGCKKNDEKPPTGSPTVQGGIAEPLLWMGDVAVPPQTNQAVEIKGAIVCPPQTIAAPTAVLGSPEPTRSIMGKVAAPSN